MTRLICFALFGLLISSGAALSQTQHHARPHPRAFAVRPHVTWHRAMFHCYHWFDPFRFSIVDFAPPPPPSQLMVPAPTYYFYGNEPSRRPRLVFKDHLTYTVEDYWRVDDQLHFITSEDGGTKSLPFADLDVQATTDLLTKHGFKFRLRDEPVEQWLKHHRRK